MITGYVSHALKENQTFREFALTVARGYVEHDHDLEPLPADIGPASTYHADKAAVAAEKIALLEALSEPARIAYGQQQKEAALAKLRASMAQAVAQNARIQALLDAVDAWGCPEEHRCLKRDMKEQLSGSIEDTSWLQSEIEDLQTQSPLVVFCDHLAGAVADKANRERDQAEEEWRHEGRRQWVRALADSLPAAPAPQEGS